jgi:GT2 family glycosyltransferase
MRAQFPQASLAPVTVNAGYAGNNNFGMSLAAAHDPEWVFLLNDDTRLAPDCLVQLVAAADEQAGILGPTVAHASNPGLIQSAGGRLTAAWEAEHLDRNLPLPDPARRATARRMAGGLRAARALEGH